MAATASFWDVVELKMNVFNCLLEDGCDADLSRCARVSPTWMDLALDALWFGHPQTSCLENNTRIRAIASLPRRLRQKYASRVGVLDFTNLGDIRIHAMCDKLAFSRLREVILYNGENHNAPREDGREFRLWKYLQPTLQSLILLDKMYHDIEDRSDWLTVSFLTEIAVRCPNLEHISLCVYNPHIDPKDVVLFFQSIQPRRVSLEFGCSRQSILNLDLLFALSCLDRLQSLALIGTEGAGTLITAEQLIRLTSLVNTPFLRLKSLELCLEADAVLWIPHCFPAVTWLQLDITSNHRDGSILEQIASMSQLQSLEIRGYGGEHRTPTHDLPARAFIPLGSLTRLKSLRISTSFFPHCIGDDDDDNATRDSDRFRNSDKFTKGRCIRHVL